MQRNSKTHDILYTNTMFSEKKPNSKIRNNVPELDLFIQEETYELTPFSNRKKPRPRC